MRFLPSIRSARTSFVTWSDAETRLHLVPTHTWTEQLKEGDVTKIYLDYDHILVGRAKDASLLDGDDVDVRRHLALVLGRLDTILDFLKTSIRDLWEPEEAEEKCGRVRFVLASRHGWCPTKGAWKLSYRPFFQGLRIRHDQIPHILRVTGQLPDAGETSFWDMTVYKPSEQLLACINGVKGSGDTRLLETGHMDREEDILNYVAQSVDEDWPLLTVPDTTLARTCIQSDGSAGEVVLEHNSSSSVPEGVMRAIVAGLSPARATERKSWIEVIWAVHAVSVLGGYVDAGEEMVITFSGRCPEKCDAHEVRRTYAQGRTTGRVLGLGSLLRWHREDNPGGHREVMVRVRQSEGAGGGGGQLASKAIDPSFQEAIRRQLTDNWPVRFPSLDPGNFQVDTGNGVTTFRYGEVGGHIKPDCCVYLEDGTFIGQLIPDVPVKGPLPCNRQVPSQHTDFVYNRVSPVLARLRTVSNPTEASLDIHQDFIEVKILGKRMMTIDKPKDMSRMAEVIKQALQQFLVSTYGPISGNVMFVNNGTININAGGGVALKDNDPNLSDSRILFDMLVDNATSKGLRRLDGFVYRPIAGCPCAYVILCTYERYINEVLLDDPVFLKHAPRNYEDALKTIVSIDSSRFPWLRKDMDLISFTNGVLELINGVFTPYLGMDAEGAMARRVARHHIPSSYTGCEETPLLDVIFDAQFGKDVAEVLCALIGRCLFKVNQQDQWQVMPFLVGVGGTGKSLIMTVCQHLFAPGAVGNLAAKREEVFGVANLIGKEVVMGRDMPAKMSASLPQDLMQCMTSGEEMEIPRKGQTALHETWTVPLIMGSNHMPDYTNTGNNIGRRMVTVRFDNVISDPWEELQQSIIDEELPNVLCRCLRAYMRMRVRVKEVRGGFWKVVPEVMLEWRGKFSAATNKLAEFFVMDDDERLCSVSIVPGHFTWPSVLKEFVEAKMGKGSFVQDAAVLASFGFRFSPLRVNVCKSCHQAARVGCCAAYSRKNITVKAVIRDMELVALLSARRVLEHTTSSAAEKLFHDEVEKYTGISFFKVRCGGLLSDTGNPLELDMYHVSGEREIAIEYNGYQHYDFPNRYHKTHDEFVKGQIHDQIKVDRCKLLKVPLIVIRGSNIVREIEEFAQEWDKM